MPRTGRGIVKTASGWEYRPLRGPQRISSCRTCASCRPHTWTWHHPTAHRSAPWRTCSWRRSFQRWHPCGPLPRRRPFRRRCQQAWPALRQPWHLPWPSPGQPWHPFHRHPFHCPSGHRIFPWRQSRQRQRGLLPPSGWPWGSACTGLPVLPWPHLPCPWLPSHRRPWRWPSGHHTFVCRPCSRPRCAPWRPCARVRSWRRQRLPAGRQPRMRSEYVRISWVSPRDWVIQGCPAACTRVREPSFPVLLQGRGRAPAPGNRSVVEAEVRVAFLPFLELLFGCVAGNALALLQLAQELFTLAINDVKVIVRELAPLFNHLAFELLPVALEGVFVHGLLPCGCFAAAMPPIWRKTVGEYAIVETALIG